jgi:hypothetical protein
VQQGNQAEQEPQRPRGRSPDIVQWPPDRWSQIARRILWAIGIAGAVVAVLVAVLFTVDVLSSIFNVPFLDLLKILAVPLTVGAAVPLFNWLQKRRELDIEDRRTQDEALLAYLDKMSELLIDKDLHKKSNDYDPMRVTARARTLALLRQLDRERKRTVLLFLREARLINRDKFGDDQTETVYHPHYIGLDGADLTGADLREARLFSSRKEPVSLKGIILAGANLEGADLRGADLKGANLRKAVLVGANLQGADLSNADLWQARGITDDKLEQQASSLAGATIPGGRKHD